LLEITFTTLAPYGSFLLAQNFDLSGVLATITAGLIIANFQPLGTISDRGKEAVQAFGNTRPSLRIRWFSFLGMRVAHQDFGAIRIPAGIAIAFVTLGRAVAIYLLCLSFSGLRVSMKHQHALFPGGLRGRVGTGPRPWPSC